MKLTNFLVVIIIILTATVIDSQVHYSWRYYRTGNTGIQGDYADAI